MQLLNREQKILFQWQESILQNRRTTIIETSQIELCIPPSKKISQNFKNLWDLIKLIENLTFHAWHKILSEYINFSWVLKVRMVIKITLSFSSLNTYVCLCVCLLSRDYRQKLLIILQCLEDCILFLLMRVYLGLESG